MGYGYGYGYKSENSAAGLAREAYSTIRTNIMFSVVKEGCKTLVFTSAIPAEGKTTSAANVAFSLARAEKKVLLLDLDLRKPKIHRIVKVRNVPGITNLLGGFNGLDEVLHKGVARGLDVITAGTMTPNPAEIISSKLMADFLGKIKENYDYIIIDTPPVNAVSDILSVLPLSDGVVLVTKYKYTHHADIKNAINQIDFVGGKIIGVIVNGTDDFKKNGKYSHYSKYGYSYGEKAPKKKPAPANADTENTEDDADTEADE